MSNLFLPSYVKVGGQRKESKLFNVRIFNNMYITVNVDKDFDIQNSSKYIKKSTHFIIPCSEFGK